MISVLITIIIFIAVLSLLVFFHEFGHFYSAKKLGIKADEFGIGFPPRIFAFYKSKNSKWRFVFGRKKIEDNIDTVYSINAIPIGGFVKIKGEDGENRGDKDSFASQKIWKRFIVIFAGVFMNFVLAWLLLSFAFMFGMPQAIGDNDEVPKGAIVGQSSIQVMQVVKDSAADEAGLKILDKVLSVNGQKLEKEADLISSISETSSEISMTIDRAGEIMEVKVTPSHSEELDRNVVGVAFSSTANVRFPWYLAFWEGLKISFTILYMIIVALYEILKGLFVGQGPEVEVAGPIGIANLTGQMANMGIVYLMQFAALLSLNLAVINFFPFPALDGGRFIFLLIEAIKGKPVKQELEGTINGIGFIALMALIVFVTVKDIIGLF